MINRAAPDPAAHWAFPDLGFLTSLPSPPAFSTTAIAALAAFSMAFYAFL